VAVLGCAVNGIGEAKHADFGIAGAKDEGVVFAHGKALKKVPTSKLVDTLFEQIDLSLDRGGKVEFNEAESAAGEAWVQKIEEENAGDLTPEKIAALEKQAALSDEADRLLVDEQVSPTAGRRFTRA
jgi:(E)-4-hydroxy-3-methylbut-2-enyl-diphosphate synthase